MNTFLPDQKFMIFVNELFETVVLSANSFFLERENHKSS